MRQREENPPGAAPGKDGVAPGKESLGSSDQWDGTLALDAYAKALEAVQEQEKLAAAAFPDGKPFPIPTHYVELADDSPTAALMPAVEFYAVNDRPVKLVPTPGGGLDVLALNMRTGEFERDMCCLTRCVCSIGDVDKFSDEASFDEYVENLRRRIAVANAVKPERIKEQ